MTLSSCLASCAAYLVYEPLKKNKYNKIDIFFYMDSFLHPNFCGSYTAHDKNSTTTNYLVFQSLDDFLANTFPMSY